MISDKNKRVIEGMTEEQKREALAAAQGAKSALEGAVDVNDNVRQNVQSIGSVHTEDAAAQQPKYTGYDDILSMLKQAKYQNEAKAENADRRARLAKAHQMVSGIADMGRAIANLYGTTQYAPNIPMESMSDKARERYEKAIAEREGYKDAAMNYALKGAGLKATEANNKLKQAEFERKLKKDEAEQTRKDNLAKAQTAAYAALEAYRNSASEQNYQKAIYWQKKAELLGLNYDDDHAESLAKQAAANALAEYRRQKAANEANGTTTTTTKTDAHGRNETTVSEKKPSGKGSGYDSNNGKGKGY